MFITFNIFIQDLVFVQDHQSKIQRAKKYLMMQLNCLSLGYIFFDQEDYGEFKENVDIVLHMVLFSIVGHLCVYLIEKLIIQKKNLLMCFY